MTDLPKLEIVLKPHHDGREIVHMDVAYSIQGLELAAGETLAEIYPVIASIPACEFSAEGLTARDAAGDLPLSVADGPGQWGALRKWTADRKTEGAIALRYRVYPRVLPEHYTSSPYFDLRTEPGGINGAGVTFLVLIKDQEYQVCLHWDLAEMPDGSRGIWSKGEGDVSILAKPETVAYSYYAAGEIKSWKTPENERFAFYWIAEPNFNVDEVAAVIYRLFKINTTFFEDPDAPYKVFARRDPFPESGGGTALADSFMFGYSDEKIPTTTTMRNMLAHEIVHNWPRIEDTEANRIWYDEGTAEYYCTMLPYRAGMTTLEDVRDEIMQRAQKYYANVHRDMPLAQAAELCWKDRRTQVLPYGRGFFYLLSVDRSIRLASGGARCLDDVVLDFVRKERQTKVKAKLDDWIEALSRELGKDARPAFEAMSRGDLIVPDAAWFDGAFKIKMGKVEQYALRGEKGPLVDSYIWEPNDPAE